MRQRPGTPGEPARLSPRSRRRHIQIQPGDRIHHPRHGLGRVQAISQRSFGGDEPATFAQLYFKRDGLTVQLRQEDLGEMLRPPMGPREAKRLLEHLATCDGRMNPQWKTRTRANQARLAKGDAFGYAEVLKGLLKLEAAGSLVAADRDHLAQATELLAEELSHALGKTTQEAAALILEKCAVAKPGT